MIILNWNLAPQPKKDDMLTDDGMVDGKPGAILAKWHRIRNTIGTVAKVKKEGMKFATLNNETVTDLVRAATDKEGVLVYPYSTAGTALAVEDGTMCGVNITFRVQAIEDGSYIQIAGFGEGADSQDKAGGKAGTYAMKAALIQALLAGGSKAKGGVKSPDTDDTETAIAGGVKAKTGKPKAPHVDEVKALFEMAQTPEDYSSALAKAKLMDPTLQLQIRPEVIAAKTRTTPAKSDAVGTSV